MANGDYERIEQALQYIRHNVTRQPSLAQIAAGIGLSEYHFQRLFTRWAGISPKKFLQYLTLDYAKRCLADSASVLEASYAAGLSGPGRLHDLFVNMESVTPGEYRRRGAGMEIGYSYHDSPCGECLLLATERGVCGLAFVTDCDHSQVLADMQERWGRARLVADDVATAGYAERIFGATDPLRTRAEPPLRLLLCGAPFQIKVWEALLRIPPGARVTYGQLARFVGRPQAARAVGTAVGHNPIAYLIPCHRVIRRDGLIGGYHWGEARKLAMLGRESARAADDQCNRPSPARNRGFSTA